MPGSVVNNVTGALSLIFFLGLMMAFYRRAMILVLELRQARDELARLAVTEERLRFARDLHDLLGHSLSTIALKSQVARKLVDRDPVALTKEVDEIGTVAQQALLEVREAVTGYRRRSTATELDAARLALAAAGIEVSVRTSGTPLPADTDGLLAWVVREGTTNVLRHSKGRMCWITLRRTDDTAGVEIRDDGVAGLAERLAAVGGRLDTGPAPGRGFRLSAHLPLADAPTSPATAQVAAP
jgi:two-component system sensor histidine kinase DesK